MLILLDKSIKNSLIDDREITLVALENLAEAIRTSKHIVIGSQNLIRDICKIEELGVMAKRCYSTLSNIASEVRGIKDNLQAYVMVRGDIDEIALQEEDGKKIYNVPVAHFNNSERLLPTRIIVEDQTDYVLYEKIAHKYMNDKGIKCKISVHSINGGGTNTYRTYANEITNTKAPCFVITDSDKKNENDTFKDTAKKVIEKYKEIHNKYITDYHVLGVREKENLITPSLYALCARSVDVKESIDLLLQMENNENLWKIYKYADIKGGIKAKEILEDDYNRQLVEKYVRNELHEMYRNKIMDENCIVKIGKMLDKVCNNNRISSTLSKTIVKKDETIDVEIIFNEILQNYSNKNQEYKVTDGVGWLVEDFQNEILGNSIEEEIEKKKSIYSRYPNSKLSKNIQELEEKSVKINEIINRLPNDIKDEWEKISFKILTWGCSIEVPKIA